MRQITWVTTQNRALSGLRQHLPAPVQTELMEHKEARLFFFSAAEAQVHICWGFSCKSWISNMLVRCGTTGPGCLDYTQCTLQRMFTSLVPFIMRAHIWGARGISGISEGTCAFHCTGVKGLCGLEQLYQHLSEQSDSVLSSCVMLVGRSTCSSWDLANVFIWL